MLVNFTTQSTGFQPQSSDRQPPSSHHSKGPRPSTSSQMFTTESEDESCASVNDNSRTRRCLHQWKQRSVMKDVNYINLYVITILSTVFEATTRQIYYFKRSLTKDAVQSLFSYVLQQNRTELNRLEVS
ncbi:hypothetical protein AAHC03_027072 [Spirometra sp. Aus1]